MDSEKRKRLAAAGFRSGSVAEFLELTETESALVEARLAISGLVSTKRKANRITQQELAKRIGTAQPRVTLIEKADKSVSMDQLFTAAIEAGADLRELGSALVGIGSKKQLEIIDTALVPAT